MSSLIRLIRLVRDLSTWWSLNSSDSRHLQAWLPRSCWTGHASWATMRALLPRIDLWDLWGSAVVCSCLDPREGDSSSDFVASFGDLLSNPFKTFQILSNRSWSYLVTFEILRGHSQIYACWVREAGELLSSEELEWTSLNWAEKMDALWGTTCCDSTLQCCS